jgi:hypothetical protein
MPATPQKRRTPAASSAAISESSPSSKQKLSSTSKTPVRSLSFSSVLRVSQVGWTFQLFKDFLLSLEHFSSLTNSHSQFRSVLLSYLPLTDSSPYSQIVDKFLVSGQVNEQIQIKRIKAQLEALTGNNGIIPDKWRKYSGLKPVFSSCTVCKKSESAKNFLHLMCSACGSTALQVDQMNKGFWNKVKTNQQKVELKALEAQEKKNENQETKEEIKGKIETKGKKTKNFSNEQADQEEFSDFALTNYRIKSSLRSISHLLLCVERSKRVEFNFHGGDVIFLLRNAIFRSHSPIAEAADQAVRAMLNKWNKSKASQLDDDSEPEHVLVFVEAIHAEAEMDLKSNEELSSIRRVIASVMKQHSIEDFVRFDPSNRKTLPISPVGYCVACGSFADVCSQKICKEIVKEGKESEGSECGAVLERPVDYQHLCEALVWTSVFRDIQIEPMKFADGSCSLADVLKFMPQIRPYKSLQTLGLANFQLQCYFLTHLMFILSGWGAMKLQPVMTYFIEEFLFLTTNLDVVIGLNDPELVGEFLCSLKILGLPDDHLINQRGHLYLLATEKSGAANQGNWLSGGNFFKKYHTAYCGLIGLKQIKYQKVRDLDKEFLKQWRIFFEAVPVASDK